MWILESRGDFFQGRRMWLKPGKQYLFGRVKKDGVQFALDHKTVSRKHLVIAIDEVKDEDVGNTRTRTAVTITDQDSKTGTSVNGERVRGPRNLTQSENVIRLGTCQEELIVKWDPVVLTYNLLKKELKAGLLRTKQGRVRELDVKAISEYVPGTSTYLVVNKRNTAKGLQALVEGKYLVDESYIDALEYAATPSDLEEEENLSLLEQDFDKAWPDPSKHLPPKGKEATTCQDISYRPNTARENVFRGYAFVFLDQTQYDNLMPMITMGHGKALIYPLVENETTSKELITFMHKVAGNKTFGDNGRDSDEGAVIMVSRDEKSNSDWLRQVVHEVALKLDQNSIEQSQFLEAILTCNAALLRQSFSYDGASTGQTAPPSTADSVASRSLPSRDRANSQFEMQSDSITSNAEVIEALEIPQIQAPSQGDQNVKIDDEQSPPARSFRFSPRIKVQSSGFDDDFDEDAIIPFEEDEEDDHFQSADGSRSPSPNGTRSEMDKTGSRKRPRSGTSGDHYAGDNQELDDFLPAATALKKLKVAMNGESASESSTKQPVKRGIILTRPKSKKVKEVDVKEELRAQREKERQKREAQLGRDDEDERPLEYDAQGNLMVYEVQIELMDIAPRKKPVLDVNDPEDAGWDPRWNGRKNFKAFRRARDKIPGVTPQRCRVHTRVIVPLVDGRQATYGIGDQYWERTEEEREQDKAKKKRASQRATPSQPTSSYQRSLQQLDEIEESDEADEEANPVAEHSNNLSQTSPALTRLQQESAEVLDMRDDVVDVDQPRRTRADDTRPESSSLGSHTQTQMQTSMRSTRGTKRAGSTSNATVAKKQKTLPVVTSHVEDSDDSDDLKFKFGKGRGRRGRGRI